MQVILDSGFILHAMHKRIDFLEQLEKQGFVIRIPKEIVQELKDLINEPSNSHNERAMIRAALQMIQANSIKHISMGKMKISDWLIHMGKQGYFIATTNAEIRHHIPKTIDVFESRGTVEPVIKEHHEVKKKIAKKKKNREWPRRFYRGGRSVKGYVGKNLEARKIDLGDPQFHKIFI